LELLDVLLVSGFDEASSQSLAFQDRNFSNLVATNK
jgi:hypothetical protein